MRRPPAGLDHRIAELCLDQHGAVRHDQLRALGLSASGIHDRVTRGALHVVHHAVYSVGSPVLSLDGRRMAAVLACGEGAALSHSSGVGLHDLPHHAVGPWHVSIASRSGRDPEGIVVHRPRTLSDDVVTTVRGIPVTTVARTLFDMAAVVGDRQLARLCDEAERRRMVDWADVIVLLDRHPRKPGGRRLRRVLERVGIGPEPTRSGLEREFLAICDRHGVPRPQVNVVVEGYEVDACWPEHRLIVEVDGDEWHRTRFRREEDKRRDAALTVAGWRVVRVTEARIATDADHVGRQLHALTRALGPIGAAPSGVIRPT